MLPKFYKNKYKRGSVRLKTHHYNWESIYFITICTNQKEQFFGKVVNGEVELNELGQITRNEWVKTEEIRKDMNLELFEFVIMPNHVHGIVKIGWNKYNTEIVDFVNKINQENPGSCAMHRAATIGSPNDDATIGNPNDDATIGNPNGEADSNSSSSAMHRANDNAELMDVFSTTEIPHDLEILVEIKKKSNNKFGPQSKNLASVIRGFKSAVTTQARKLGNKNFEWQSRFHEHIIREERAFKNIQKYIINNPKNWTNK
jgi:REP element-mobilizing transposase RayT